ncbi:uncharacterized protein AMSG_00793 [Thecamonas trahens ATCC 50062]|uniref:Glucosidase 2 subunit beta-like domain-containing protein n=1 Tax=Thecamonas trahens ATCC 50062 TaxID=461836 RepID=A0A0L0DER4_THETB|nr:hypothetical protein AMSG_00793 [Thecamonas trahens ATCC 50062]KNC50631.1 hypothetical protein AMSG_00793 [Thecamonas trahens ATCC 50062]|eukprot:XP_013762517.1 hypothetical protein AMSG_00793 [Thecamonas trahens ATCC 50062]
MQHALLLLPLLLLLTVAAASDGTPPPALVSFTVDEAVVGSTSVSVSGTTCTFTFDTRPANTPNPPPPSPPPPATGEAEPVAKIMAMLVAELPKSPCLVHTDGLGYTYEVCAGRGGRITQTGLGENNVVGVFKGPGGPIGATVLYDGGDRCFDTGAPRIAFLHFVCPTAVPPQLALPAGAELPTIVSVAELAKCEYSFFIASETVCGDDRFDAQPTTGVTEAKRTQQRTATPGQSSRTASRWVLEISPVADAAGSRPAPLALTSFALSFDPPSSPLAARVRAADYRRLDVDQPDWIAVDGSVATTAAFEVLSPAQRPVVVAVSAIARRESLQ